MNKQEFLIDLKEQIKLQLQFNTYKRTVKEAKNSNCASLHLTCIYLSNCLTNYKKYLKPKTQSKPKRSHPSFSSFTKNLKRRSS